MRQNRRSSRFGQVTFSSARVVGRSISWAQPHSGMASSTESCAFRTPCSEFHSGRGLDVWVREPMGAVCFESGRFAAIASGTSIFHIGVERAAEMPVVATDLEAQRTAVETVEAADRAAERPAQSYRR